MLFYMDLWNFLLLDGTENRNLARVGATVPQLQASWCCPEAAGWSWDTGLDGPRADSVG